LQILEFLPRFKSTHEVPAREILSINAGMGRHRQALGASFLQAPI